MKKKILKRVDFLCGYWDKELSSLGCMHCKRDVTIVMIKGKDNLLEDAKTHALEDHETDNIRLIGKK